MKAWDPNMDLGTETLKSLPIWIRLPDLDLKYWGLNSLSKICSAFSIPLKTYKYIKGKTMIRYARVLVDMQLEGSFPDFIEFFNEQNVLVRQQIQYEWVLVKCLFCGMYGHKEDVCKRKDGARKEWRVKQKVQELDPRLTPHDTQVAGSQNALDFTMVAKGKPAAVLPQFTSSPRFNNSFQTEKGVEQAIHSHILLFPYG